MPRRPVAVTSARPLIQMDRTIALLLTALLMATLTLAVASPVRAAGGDGLREAANGYRQGHGLAAVAGAALLDDIATHRAARMARQNVLAHDMTYVNERLNAAGVCWSGFGEIIAWERGYPDYSYERTLKQWWDSPPHHGIMMGEGYNAAGGAWTTADDGGHYSVMVFVTLCGAAVTAEPVSKMYPSDRYDPDRELVLKEGRVTAYRLARSGAVLSQKSVKLSRTARVRAAGRARDNGRAWLKMSSGALDGYWVHETKDAYVRGMTERDAFVTDRHVTLEAGRYLGLRFDRLGRIKAHRTYWFGHARTMSASEHGIINGRPYLMLSSGPLSGYWVQDTRQVHPA